MTQETGPIYCVPLIDTLPLDSLPLGEAGWQHEMPSLDDLEDCILKDCDRVAAGYEVLLAHYYRVCEERDRLRCLLREINEWDRDYPSLAQGLVDRIAKELDT